MNIDERLEKLGLLMEKLSEKHEKLTQSVALLVSMHSERKRQFEEHKPLVTVAIESIAETNRQLTQMLAAMRNEQVQMRDEQLQGPSEFRDAMMRLSVIAEAHHAKRLGRPAA